MYHKVLTYTDYDGNEQTEDAYFNLNKMECIELDLEFEEEGGLLEHLKKMFVSRNEGDFDKNEAKNFIKLLVDRSYGIRPKDNPSLFLKLDENGNPLINRFRQSIPYSDFIWSLLNGEVPLDDFATNVLPNVPASDLEMAKQRLKDEGFDPAAIDAIGTEASASAT